MTLPFYKLEANGNDFILIQRANLPADMDLPQLARQLCAPKTAIGADGLLLVDAKHSDVDFALSYFNPDGSSGMLCGNGALSALFFVCRHLKAQTQYSFRLGDQIYHGFARDLALATQHKVAEMVLKIPQVTEVQKLRDAQYYLHTGAAHKVIFFPHPVDKLDLPSWAEKYRYGVNGAVGANVSLAYFAGARCQVRTFEKGVEAETLACGTGAVACALAWFWHTQGKALATAAKLSLAVEYAGGTFQVRANWSGTDFYAIELQAKAREVFHGFYYLG